MITYKIKEYSTQEDIIQRAIDDLEDERIYDYEVTDKISKNSISVAGDLSNLEIWIPRNYEFVQYSIDDCIREMLPYAYTNVKLESSLYKMTIRGKLNYGQYFKLLKLIIDEADFVTIVE